MSSSIVFQFLFYSTTILLAKSAYIIDIIEIESNVTTTNNCDMSWEVTQPTRGVFAVSGIWDIKEDINTDNSKGYVDVYYSKNGITYMLTPFRIPPTVFTEGINFMYKQFLMPSMTKCCENAIDFEDKFVTPLTKRRMVCTDCVINGENYPSPMRTGFYRMVGVSEGNLAFAITVTIKLEME